MNTMTNIVLIGFKSCGKTTIGRLLAQRMHRCFVDLDTTIEELAAVEFQRELSFAQIYAEYGAETFRALEQRALQSLTELSGAVLATGGGAPCSAANQALLQVMGVICYIRTPPELLMERYRRRRMPPYLRDNPTLENLTTIWNERDCAYRQIADIIVDTDDAPQHYQAERLQALLTPLLAEDPSQ